MKTCPDFQQTTDTPVNVDTPICRLRDSAKNLQQSGLPGAISPDNSENFTAMDVQ
jgi:hypothetical protein